MSKIKYTVKENNRVGTHSFYAIPVPTGVLDFKELCEEACEDNTYSPEEMLGCVSRFMKTVQRETLRGFRCKLGEDFLTVYPNSEVSVKDHKDKEGNDVVATAAMVTANGAKSRLGCTVHKKFSAKFAQEVQWQKVDANGVEVEEEDITQNNSNVNPGDEMPPDNDGTGGIAYGNGENEEP